MAGGHGGAAAGGGAVYGLGMIGAWVYLLSTAPDFWSGVLRFFEGMVWPAFVVYNLMKHLGM